ncbi:DUF4167 domain-containing protein [Methylocystis rosea]|uniref:DUF4167 domain-containing protein n=1 Tax=Methylocystis rosea TaxID=173366 RepID=UPI000A0461B0
MQNGTHRGPKIRGHGSAVGPFSGRSEASDQKRGRPAGIRFIDAKGSYERYLALARVARSTGDATEIENYLQHADHYFRLLREQVGRRRSFSS